MTCPSHFSAIAAASRASRAWAGPETTCHAPRLAAILAVTLCSLSLPRADILHLRGGRTLRVSECRQEALELRCRLAGGVIGFPVEEVERVEKEARPSAGSSPRRRNPAGHEASLLPPIETVPSGAAEPTLEEARARIESLGRALSSPGADARAIHGEMAVLYSWLGNMAMAGNDIEGAERNYATALEHEPRLMVARLNRATALINLNRYEAADRILHEILSDQPDNARALDLLGESAVQTGRVEEGIELWERSLALQPSASLTARLERARRILTAEKGFDRTTGAHFALKFDGGEASPELASEILDYLEEGYSDLTRRFAHEPEAVIQTILYSTRAFREATASPDWVGGLFDGQIRVPIRGLTHVTPQTKRVLIHELTHCLVASRSRGNAPQWLQEGIAQVVEGRSSAGDRQRLLAAWQGPDGARSAAEFSYPRALSQMEFFLERWSDSHLNALLDRLGRGDDIDASLQAVTGLSYQEFLASWGAWLES
ncbi:MAG TPA: tetratricopeptide repeat protein [Candidatus Polarisedimenticolia bacterium]